MGNTIPRLDCLGLIEARLFPSPPVPDTLIPRLDCLGLIEAMLVRYLHSIDALDSEA